MLVGTNNRNQHEMKQKRTLREEDEKKGDSIESIRKYSPLNGKRDTIDTGAGTGRAKTENTKQEKKLSQITRITKQNICSQPRWIKQRQNKTILVIFITCLLNQKKKIYNDTTIE